MQQTQYPANGASADAEFTRQKQTRWVTQGVSVDGKSEIRELQVLGDWAYLRVSMTTPAGTTIRRAGYTRTILRKEPDGKWRLARDANLLTLQE